MKSNTVNEELHREPYLWKIQAINENKMIVTDPYTNVKRDIPRIIWDYMTTYKCLKFDW